MATKNSLTKALKKEGLRFTNQRQAVWDEIKSNDDHRDAEEIYSALRSNNLNVSRATVYRTIKLFEEAGIIETLDIGDGRARYEEAGEHHEHLVDVETGEIIEFQEEDLEEMKRQVALKMGYELVDHKLELYGVKKKPQ